MSLANVDIFARNRAVGAVAFDVRHRDGMTRRGQLHESGSLRVRFPSPDSEGLSAVFVNTAGGVAGGDSFTVDIHAAENARLTVTTAAAEKIYRSHGPDALLDITLRVDAGAHLAWVPQETILFDQARACRRIEVDLDAAGSIVLCEMVVFGRTAMGERMRRGAFVDRWRLRRGGKLVFAETVRLENDFAAALERAAAANGGVAIGTILVAPGDEALVEKIRDISPEFRSEVGVSCWNGFAMVRFCAQDAAQLRIDAMAVLAKVLPSGPPRIWL